VFRHDLNAGNED